MTLRDRLLVEWVAQASVGDRFPEPWSWARNPLESVVRTLADLGVIERPAAGARWATVAHEATTAARVWLDEHPPPGGPGAASR